MKDEMYAISMNYCKDFIWSSIYRDSLCIIFSISLIEMVKMYNKGITNHEKIA